MQPTVSLIVTTYNRKETLSLCLKSVSTQSHLPTDVVVADDGSRADTADLIADVGSTIPVPLRHAWQEDRGFRAGRARNRAVALSQGAYVIFIDGDMLLHPEFIADHLALIQPGTYLQGGRLNASREESDRLLRGGDPRFTARMPFAPHVGGELRAKHAFRSRVIASLKAAHRRGGVAMSCNLGVWRKDLDLVNGFNHDFEGWGREDTDLTLRLRYAGVRRRLLRYAGLAIHLWHPTRWSDATPPGGWLPNDVLLEHTRRSRSVRCERGLDVYTSNAKMAERAFL
jgi:glycosyltransferase involved in cell wall biosynthesis